MEREVNEDRFHADADRGLFIVIDGVGGHAAGGKAADVAMSMLRERLGRETGPLADRIREAITIANNEIHRLASTRAEWDGMACVLTVVVVHNGSATIGHVGDTRVYKIRGSRIEKLTRDHSPVGEREDANELSELQAMRHPRRNEVYRDVGSDPHDPSDLDFIDIDDVPFEADAALLLCSDGLTDLVDSTAIGRTVRQFSGDPDAVARALIDAANAAGGKDNVTVVYVEGEHFAAAQSQLAGARSVALPRSPASSDSFSTLDERRPFARLAVVAAVVAGAIGLTLAGLRGDLDSIAALWRATAPSMTGQLVVNPQGSIAGVIRDAPAGAEIIVEPGEYREQLVLKDRVRVVSRVPRGATLRLPAAASDTGPVAAVVAQGVSGAELAGFRIVGDSATPLGIGISVKNSAASIVDVEITGATTAALEFSGDGASTLLASEIRDNPGAAVVIRDRAVPRIGHTAFVRSGSSAHATAALIVEAGSAPAFFRNVFIGLSVDAFVGFDDAAHLALKRDNWFLPVADARLRQGSGGQAPLPQGSGGQENPGRRSRGSQPGQRIR
jgi:serine/threonine protein phosphatase PrpC